jgi:hypothetical protein
VSCSQTKKPPGGGLSGAKRIISLRWQATWLQLALERAKVQVRMRRLQEQKLPQREQVQVPA